MTIPDSRRDELAAGPPLLPRSVHEESPLIDVRDLAHSAFRWRWLMAVIVGATVLASVVVTSLQDRIYESEATVFVNPRKTHLTVGAELGQLPGIAALAGVGEGGIATEAALLQSRAIAEAVVDSLSLHVQLEDPAISYVNVFKVVEAPRDAAPGRFEFRRQSDGTYSVQALQAADASIPESVTVGRPFQLGDVTLSLLPQLGDQDVRRLVIAIQPFDRVVRSVRSDLEIAQYARGAQVLSVRARHPDSVRAAEIPNTATRSFIRYRTELTKAEARNAVGFLRDQVASYSTRLRTAEEQLQRFSEQSRVVSLPEESSQQVRHLADLEARRNLLVAERIAVGSALARADQRAGMDSGTSSYRELGSFPVFLANGAVQSILRTLTELENELSELLNRRTPENDDVQRLVRRIAELERQLYETARSYQDGLESQIASLDASLSRFSGQLESVPLQQLTYARLRREQHLLEEIYTLLETRLKEAEIREVEDLSDVRILDAALIPERPISPRPLVNLILALILGGMLGVGTVVVRAILDPRVRTRNDLVWASAGLPVVGLIPDVPEVRSNGRGVFDAQRLRRLLPLAAEKPVKVNALPLVVRTDPESAASEAYRALRTNLTFGVAEDRPRVITICSVGVGDGKSTSAANLALTMARQGIRTLLIDCDLRRPRLHTIFSEDSQPGLADVLAARCEFDAAVRQVDVAPPGVPMHLLTSGAHSANAAEMIGSPVMRELLHAVRSTHELVILDAPPLSVASEAVVLGALADTTLLVARATVTEKRALAEAVAQLRQLHIPIAGIVINGVKESDLAYQPYGRSISVDA